MANLENPATIHHPQIMAEAVVPASTVAGWVAVGWVAGPFPADAGGRPPKTGRNSGRDAWVAYAESREVVVAEDATREDIIVAVERLDEQIAAARQPEVGEPAPLGATPEFNPEEG